MVCRLWLFQITAQEKKLILCEKAKALCFPALLALSSSEQIKSLRNVMKNLVVRVLLN